MNLHLLAESAWIGSSLESYIDISTISERHLETDYRLAPLFSSTRGKNARLLFNAAGNDTVKSGRKSGAICGNAEQGNDEN